MNDDKTTPAEWTECCPGEIRKLVTDLRMRRRRQVLTRATTAVASVCICAGLGLFAYSVVNSPATTDVVRLTCQQVHDLASQFVSGELDARVVEQVRIHLIGCPKCQRWVDHVRSDSAQTAAAQTKTTQFAATKPVRADATATRDHLTGLTQPAVSGRSVPASYEWPVRQRQHRVPAIL